MKRIDNYSDKLYLIIFDAPMYMPHGSVAFTTGGLYYLLGVIFFGQCIRIRRYQYIVVSLISLISGSAFVARGIYSDDHVLDSRAYVASMVLNELGPCFVIIPNTLLLIRLLKSTVLAPCKGTAVNRAKFVAIAACALFSALAVLEHRLVRTAVVSQAVTTSLFIAVTGWLVAKHREMRRRKDWIAVILAGAAIILVRFILRAVQVLSLTFKAHRRHESGWYGLDSGLMFLVVFMWIAVDISARFNTPHRILICNT
ncbi:hypothetical protein DL89DRAFT_294536 [Linderina pennispora]|uniref:Uncharacterized protein n=1 Tax=Linderina pennispora TaxID=61395 RepID=A0A1Y1W3H7_9FUNG|nr:uncharacterized protein DL89DRAFT_294536 [Linderina pennispora]ORX68017.1 hypothetical protein DL89DRAFT_294536 [Linderina pennispora]